MAISGFVSITKWGRNSESEGGGAYPARLRPQDAEEVVKKRRRHVWSALPGTQDHSIVPAWKVTSDSLLHVASVNFFIFLHVACFVNVNYPHQPAVQCF